MGAHDKHKVEWQAEKDEYTKMGQILISLAEKAGEKFQHARLTRPYPEEIREQLSHLRDWVSGLCVVCVCVCVSVLSRAVCMCVDFLGVCFQVPYPKTAGFNPKAVKGVCATFKGLLLPEEDGVTSAPPIVEAMERVASGMEDATLFARHLDAGLPKLRGTGEDSSTDLPLNLQTKLQSVTNTITGGIQELTRHEVGVHLAVLVCVRSARILFGLLCSLCRGGASKSLVAYVS